jgi:riboflavin synthase
MFTGIVEAMGTVVGRMDNEQNVDFWIESSFSSELKIDQSVAHNGACLTVVEVRGSAHRVTAIRETLLKTNLGDWAVGTMVNLERCLKMGDRLDGHWVQGHVDGLGKCVEVNDDGGSWRFRFEHENKPEMMTVPKGSITVNGVSLTVVDSTLHGFSVAIIPYTYEHTNFHSLKVGDSVNLEFDILGKYLQRMMMK